MNTPTLHIKLDFVAGLKEIVLDEIKSHQSLSVIKSGIDSLYLEYTENFMEVLRLKTVSHAYLVVQDAKYNPIYISKHKSVAGDLISKIINTDVFNSFKILAAGSDSTEIRSIARYIETTYKLAEKDDADLKLHIVKLGEIWETGVQITPRPLSVRDYKVKNMSGAMDPTVAHAMNLLCDLENKESYLNIFSGSATLPIEAALAHPNLKKIIGLDKEKKRISLAIQNIKKAGLIKKITLVQKDIFEKPDVGTFDVIVSDLPFGMAIAKNDDLKKLYQCFLEYCANTLNNDGVVAMYTSEFELLEDLILQSPFTIVKTLELKSVTVVNSYLRTKIFICERKE